MHAVLTVAGIAAALATVVFANLGMTLGTGIAAGLAVALIADGWRRND